MNSQSLMQLALGDKWQQLPPALKAHYQYGTNIDIGHLDINYPIYMQPYLFFLRLFGALIDRRGKNIFTTVDKHMQGNIQYWKRTIRFPNNKIVFFKSFWVHDRNNELIEFVNSFIGLRMRVRLQDNTLHYDGQHFVIKIGTWLLPIPECLILGHTSIMETALSDNEFEMDFKLSHPILGTLFRYSGKFKTTTNNKT